jgi:hypothetical protein
MRRQEKHKKNTERRRQKTGEIGEVNFSGQGCREMLNVTVGSRPKGCADTGPPEFKGGFYVSSDKGGWAPCYSA